MIFNPQFDILAVHQMGKVGSTSVLRTLETALPSHHVFHTHQINLETLLNIICSRIEEKSLIDQNVAESIKLRRLLIQAEKLRSVGKKGPRVHLISLTRDPVARNISAFFENVEKIWMRRLSGDDAEALQLLLRKRKIGIEEMDSVRNQLEKFNQKPPIEQPEGTHMPPLQLPAPVIDSLVQALQRIFLEQYPPNLPENWIEQQLVGEFQIPIYDHPFPHQKGYQIIEQENCRLLILKIENLSRTLMPALNEYLGIEVPAEKKANVGASKKYSSLYSKFVDQVRIPESYLKQIYKSKMVRHFYSEEEIEIFRNKWHKPQL